MTDRKRFDEDDYIRRIQTSPCFICEMVAGRLNDNHVVYQDDSVIVFLNKYPTLYGYTLVAPVEHREHVTGHWEVSRETGMFIGISHRSRLGFRFRNSSMKLYETKMGY